MIVLTDNANNIEELLEILSRNYEIVQQLYDTSLEFDLLDYNTTVFVGSLLDVVYELLTDTSKTPYRVINAIKLLTFAELLLTIAIELGKDVATSVANTVLRSIASVDVKFSN